MGINMMFHPASLVEDMPVVCQRLLLGATGVLDQPVQSSRPSNRCHGRPSHNTIMRHDTERPSPATTFNLFTLFPNLPAEIRDLIWSFAIDHPSERLFHVERLRPASSDPAIAKWRFYRRLRTDTGVTASSDGSTNYQDNEDFPPSKLSPSLTATAVGATCSEARAVLLRTQRTHQRDRLDDKTSSTDLSTSSAAPSPLAGSKQLPESFNPSRDVLYFDSACLGSLPTASAARSRIKALATPMMAREVEILGVDLHCVLSTSYAVPSTAAVSPCSTAQDCPNIEDVQTAVLQALCDGFPRLRKIILITSRQRLPRKRGFTEIISSATASTAASTTTTTTQHDKTSISEILLVGARLVVRVPLLTLAAGLDTLLLLGFGGHANEYHNYPSTQDEGDNGYNNNSVRRKTFSAREIAEEHECCKTLAACLVAPSDLETSPAAKDWTKAMDAAARDVRDVLARLAVQDNHTGRAGGSHKTVPVVVETKVVVREGGCTGPWTYRARIANGSCSNDEWFWGQKKGTGLPVWKIRDEALAELEFS